MISNNQVAGVSKLEQSRHALENESTTLLISSKFEKKNVHAKHFWL